MREDQIGNITLVGDDGFGELPVLHVRLRAQGIVSSPATLLRLTSSRISHKIG